MRVGVTVNFQFSLFSNGVHSCALAVAETIRFMGHDVTLVNRGSSADWWEDVTKLKEIWPNRVQADSVKEPFDLLVELTWSCADEAERQRFAKKSVWFARKPALLSDMELSTYIYSIQRRNLSGVSEVWTWDWVSSDDTTYITCLTKLPVKKLPYVWTPTVPEVHMRSLGYPYWSEIQGRPEKPAWRIHVAETNQSNCSNATLPLVIMREMKRRGEVPMGDWRIHNADNIKASQFFKDNVLAHSQIEGLSGEFIGRQRCIDWAMEPASCLLSHIRFLPFRPVHLDVVWAGIPMIHNSLFLKEIGCGWERLYYPDNNIVEACAAFQRMNEDYISKSGIFAAGARDMIRARLLQRVAPEAQAAAWNNLLATAFLPAPAPAPTLIQPAPASIQPAPVPSLIQPAPAPAFRVAFTDMWDNFNPSYNFFTLLLEEASKHLKQPYRVEVVQTEPDLLIFGPFGETWKSFPDSTPKVHFSGENTPPVQHPSVKLNIGYKHLDFTDDSYMRFPLWMMEIDWFNCDTERIQNPKPIPIDRVTKVFPEEIERKKKFCAFVVTNPKNPIRNQAFLALNSYRKVDSAGRLFNNVGDQIFAGLGGGGGELKKLEFLKDYKFSITYENESDRGYTTEKLLHAKAAGCVPIYWGDPIVERDFDPAGFVDARGCRDTDELIALVKSVDENQEEWTRRFNVPALDEYKRDLVRRNLSELARRLIKLCTGQETRDQLPRFLGAVSAPKPKPQQQPLFVTAVNFKFLPSLHYWLDSLSTSVKPFNTRIYTWPDIPQNTITTLKEKYPFAEFLPLPIDSFKPFPDYWEPQHYAWKCWIYNEVASDPTLAGRQVLYLDAGAMLVRWPTQPFEIASSKGICFFEDPTQFNHQWCNQQLIQHMTVLPSELERPQLWAGAIAFQAGHPAATQLFSEAFQLSQRREVIAGAKWEGIRDGKPFGHRHDQSILSILAIRRAATTLPLYDYYSHESLRIASITGATFYVHRGNFIENRPFLPKIDDVMLINLDNRKDRLERLTSTHPELKGKMSRIAACNGRQLTLTPAITRLFAPNDFMWKKSILGCALSHLKVWKQLVDESASIESYLILEDDVKFQRGWQERWYSAVAAGAIPDDFDVIYLGGILPPNKGGFEMVKEKVNDHFSRVKPNQIFGQPQPSRYFHFCNYAYVLSKRGAAKILEAIKERGGYYTSADHMVCNRTDMNLYFLDPLVAGCYQDDDPAYAGSQFNNFNRVDNFDSDLWNNDERFVPEAGAEAQELDIELALADAWTSRPEPEPQLSVPPPPSQETHPADRIYVLEEHHVNQAMMMESGWLGYLLKRKDFQIKKHPASGILDCHPIFLLQKPHIAAYEKLAAAYAAAGKPFSLIHLSDEHAQDNISIYNNPSCKRVIRNYQRPGLPPHATTIPLGFHWATTRNHHPANPIINSPSLPFREQLWSFYGTRWVQRDAKLEALKSIQPHNLTLYDSWEAKKLGEKEYLARLLDSVFVPCPAGNNSETFRFYEALDAGCIPIVSRDDMDPAFLDFIGKNIPMIVLNNWGEAPLMIQQVYSNKDFLEKYRVQILMAWQAWKERVQSTVLEQLTIH